MRSIILVSLLAVLALPVQATETHRIQYKGWDVFLDTLVFDPGLSDRVVPRTPTPPRGSRRVRGNTNVTRLEGSRLFYHQLSPKSLDAIATLRSAFEMLPESVPLEELSPDEQLAYWLNLRTIGVVEKIADIYPKRTLARYFPEILEERRLMVLGKAMSVKDIDDYILMRWQDPRVIYGFYNGTVGGPSIQKQAYTGSNVWDLLAKSGKEFVTSLRGIQLRDGTLKVARYYEPYMDLLFKGDEQKLRNHLAAQVNLLLASRIHSAEEVKFTIKDNWIADLYSGEYLSNDTINDNPAGTPFKRAAALLKHNSSPLPQQVQDYATGIGDRFKRKAQRGARVRIKQVSSGEVKSVEAEEGGNEQ